MVFRYNSDIDPTRPQCFIQIINTRYSDQFVDSIDAIADTGADITMIPEKAMLDLGDLIEAEPIECSGINSRTTLSIYIVHIKIGDHIFKNTQVAVIPKSFAIVGRDILNRNKAFFDANRFNWRLDCNGNCGY
ncbi:aspartyl protease family protein [Acaryochloris marina NIES-2412]|uniref:aspartyl protease family protein n=1 Tax=Acaryochloris marina TaxID=155978 RepID=UPI004057DDAB